MDFFFIKAFVYETSWHYDWEPSVYNAYQVGGSAVFLSGTKLASFFSDDTEWWMRFLAFTISVNQTDFKSVIHNVTVFVFIDWINY